MRKFDSNVQVLKYKVLREVARHYWEGEEIFSVFNEGSHRRAVAYIRTELKWQRESESL